MSGVAGLVVYLVIGVLLGVAFSAVLRTERWVASRSSWYRWHIRPKLTAPFRLYQHFWWRVLPDGLFLMWLRAGVIDEDAYRSLQDQGFVENDVDPEYIEKYR